MEQHYIVNLVSAVDVSKRDAIAAEVEGRLGMPRAKVLKLLEHEPGPITKPIDKALAERVAQALQAAGVEAEAAPHDWKNVLLLESQGEFQEASLDALPEELRDENVEWPTIPFDATPLSDEALGQTPANPETEATVEPPVAGEGADDGAHASSVSYEASVDESSPAAFPEALASESVPPEETPDPVVAARSPSPLRWLVPLLLVLVGLGLAFVVLPNVRSVNNTPGLDVEALDPETLDAEPASEAQTNNEDAPLEASSEEATQPAEAADVVGETSESTEEGATDAEETVAEPETVAEEDAAGVQEDAGSEAESEIATEADAVTEAETVTEVADDTEAAESDAEEIIETETLDPLEDLKVSAEAGNLDAQLELAERYSAGEGVERDLAQAALWYERAAAAGDEGAQYELGWLYANGIGLERDLEAATSWYEASALSGNAEAQYQLGFYRYFGQGGAQDLGEARTLFRAAAEQGVAEARFRLGVMYLEGEGGDVDEAEAERWLRLAGEQGITEVEPYLERLAAQSSSDQSSDEQASEEVIQESGTDAQDDAPTAGVQLTSEVSADAGAGGVQRLAASGPLSDLDKAFFEVVKTEDAATIAQAIRAGADVNARDPYGQTPLMYAASYNRSTAIAELIFDLAEVNAQSSAGWTALMYAARDNPDVVEALLERGANPALTNSDGQTALDIARAANSSATELLAEAVEATVPESDTPESETLGTESEDLN